MSFIPLDPFPPTNNPEIVTRSARIEGGSTPTDQSTKLIIDQPRNASFRREVVIWRTPHLGFIKMYINPQQMAIQDKKDITPRRTKGGFIIQYAGEDLTEIRLSGTTGSSGIEGINILRSVYRAEQEAFEGIAVALDEQLAAVQVDSLINSENPFQRLNIFQLASDTIRNLGRPQPTLASLATQIEMFFQGVLYRGFFRDFSVTETADHMGLFTYEMHFTAYARQGVRRNFMPWHRQPVNPANYDVNPFSFNLNTSATVNTTNTQQTIPNQNNPRRIERPLTPVFTPGRRSTATGTTEQGLNVSGRTL